MPDPKEPDTDKPDPARDRASKVEPVNPAELPSPAGDPTAKQKPKVEKPSVEPPGDLDDGPLVA